MHSAKLLLMVALLPAVLSCSDAKSAQEMAKLKAELAEAEAALQQKVATSTEAAQPGITIERYDELEISSNLEAVVWRLKAFQVKSLTLRLYVIRDGAADVARELVLEWDEWGETADEWQLYYVMQQGAEFGVPEKRLPTFHFQAGDNKTSTVTGTSSPLVIEGDFNAAISQTTSTGEISSERNVILNRVWNAQSGNAGFEYGNSIESMTNAAQDGRVFVALEVAWEPLE